MCTSERARETLSYVYCCMILSAHIQVTAKFNFLVQCQIYHDVLLSISFVCALCKHSSLQYYSFSVTCSCFSSTTPLLFHLLAFFAGTTNFVSQTFPQINIPEIKYLLGQMEKGYFYASIGESLFIKRDFVLIRSPAD